MTYFMQNGVQQNLAKMNIPNIYIVNKKILKQQKLTTVAVYLKKSVKE